MNKLFKTKRGQLSSKVISAIEAIILIVVLLLLYADLVPEAQTAGDTLNETGVPLGSLFASQGVVFILVMVGLLLIILQVVLPRKK